jgi:CubicO group peptidase (beta-lactamase class C family)
MNMPSIQKLSQRLIPATHSKHPLFANLSKLTDIGDEAPLELSRVSAKQKQQIWQASKWLYRTGDSSYVSLCIRKHGHIVLNRSLGEGAHNAPVCIFSASKIITAMAVHHMQDQQWLQLSDKIGKYIPEYAAHGKQHTTIAHLLNHTAGIARVPQPVSHDLLFDNAEIIRRICAHSAQSKPGSQVAYHALTAGYILAEIVQRITGASIQAYVAEHFEKPMEMDFFNFGLVPALRPLAVQNTACGIEPYLLDRYLTRLIGGNLTMAVELTNDPRFMDVICPSANIYTSAEQMGRFMQMLLNNGQYQGRQIISSNAIANAKRTSSIGFDRTLLVPMRYGLGPMLGMAPVGLFGSQSHRSFGHLGFSHVLAWADPYRDISVSILTNGKGVLCAQTVAMANLVEQINRSLQPK